MSTNRNYNDFSVGAIYKYASQTPSPDGWLDDAPGDTPVTADNLNAMLKMLIDIRNVIGKTTDFAKNINNVDLYKTKIEDGKEIEDIQKSVYPNPDDLDNRSIAKYLEAAFNAIIGEPSDSSEKLTLNSIKNCFKVIDCGTAAEFIDNGGTN